VLSGVWRSGKFRIPRRGESYGNHGYCFGDMWGGVKACSLPGLSTVMRDRCCLQEETQIMISTNKILLFICLWFCDQFSAHVTSCLPLILRRSIDVREAVRTMLHHHFSPLLLLSLFKKNFDFHDSMQQCPSRYRLIDCRFFCARHKNLLGSRSAVFQLPRSSLRHKMPLLSFN
jgi:hypothetical protein